MASYDKKLVSVDYCFLEDVGRCVDGVHRQHMCHKRELGDSGRAEHRVRHIAGEFRVNYCFPVM